MRIILSVFSFILGCCMASFAGVVIVRIPNKISIVKPNSRCDNCNTELKWYDNIPIISYLILRGKCRYCHNKIPFIGFLFEIIGGISFLLIFLKFGIDYNTLIGFSLAFLFIIIAGIDYNTHYIYDLTLIMFLILAAISYIIPQIINLEFDYMGLIGLAVGFIFFFLVKVIAKLIAKVEALGMGDVYLMAIAGLLLGPYNLLFSILIASVVGSIIEITLIALKKKSRDMEIAFGPYLLLGVFIAYLYGNMVIEAIMKVVV